MPHILIAFQIEGVKRLRTLIEIETVPAFAGLSADNLVGRIDLYISRIDDDEEAYNIMIRENGLRYCLVHAGVRAVVAESFVEYLESICTYFGLEPSGVLEHCTVANWVEQLICEADTGGSPEDSESGAGKVLVLNTNKQLTANIMRSRTTRRVVRVVNRQLEPPHPQQGPRSLARQRYVLVLASLTHFLQYLVRTQYFQIESRRRRTPNPSDQTPSPL
jgi:hypothetical protein